MKNRKCPNHKACWDYGSCESCELGKEITRLYKRIDRLKKQNETLTIKRNAWALAAKAVGEDLHATRTELTRLQEENERLRNRITCQVVVPDEKLEEIKNECLERVELDIKAIQADTVRKMQSIITENYAVSKVHYVEDEAPTITYQLTNWQLDQIAKELLEGENEKIR